MDILGIGKQRKPGYDQIPLPRKELGRFRSWDDDRREVLNCPSIVEPAVGQPRQSFWIVLPSSIWAEIEKSITYSPNTIVNGLPGGLLSAITPTMDFASKCAAVLSVRIDIDNSLAKSKSLSPKFFDIDFGSDMFYSHFSAV